MKTQINEEHLNIICGFTFVGKSFKLLIAILKMGKPNTNFCLLAYLMLSFLVCGRLHAQNDYAKNLTITWKSPTYKQNYTGKPSLALHFENAIIDMENHQLPMADFYIGEGSISNYQLKDIVTENLSPQEQSVLDQIGNITLKQPQLHVRFQRNTAKNHLVFTPLLFDSLSSAWKKIVSFNLAYEKEGIKNELTSNQKLTNSNSVLAEGNWYKFTVTKNGVYKIDAQQLTEAGINIASIDPRNIRIHGNGGGMLPQANDKPRLDDLTENAIFVHGEEDGRFDNNDFILFYGEDPNNYEYDLDESQISYQKNIYSDSTCYFLTIGDVQGRRLESQSNDGNGFDKIINYDFYEAYETDQFNLLSSGRTWFGEGFRTAGQDFTFDIPGISPNSQGNLEIKTLSFQSYDNNSKFEISIDGDNLGTQTFQGVTSYIYGIQGKEKLNDYSFDTNNLNTSDGLSVNLQFTTSANNRSVGYLDYMVVSLPRKLALYGNGTNFRSLASLANTNSTFEVAGMNEGDKIWDVTDPTRPKAQEFEFVNASSRGLFGVSTTELKEFIVFNDDYLVPNFAGSIANQNLHGMSVPDMVIISYPDFVNQAQRLASFRQQNDGLDVAVVTIDQVYNEFSSGVQDVTGIRDFMKYLYDKGSNDKLKYLLLFGDCTFDYKEINTIGINKNKIPIYESRNSLWPTRTYSSDDYYGFLDEDEGEWEESSAGDHLLDIGIGRLPVNTVEEATVVVDKLIYYATNRNTLGNWRNEITLIADDSDGDGFRHFKDAEILSTIMEDNYSQFNVNKLYLDAFNQELTPNGEKAPEFKTLIEQAIDKGTLIVNYTGHGNEERLAEETIIDLDLVNGLDNYDHMALFVTATCEFGRYDSPILNSGAEALLLNPNGGAIGMLTTSRPVFSDSNLELNRAFYNAVFERVNGEYPRLGDIMVNTKNNSLEGFKNRNFSLLGDPSMRLNYPEKNVVIDRINGIPVTTSVDPLGALNKVTMNGSVMDGSASVVQNYNGVLEAVIYDKKTTKETLESEGTKFNFDVQDNIIYKGKVSIENGNFELEFVVPKNISYLAENGKISLYAQNQDDLIDANGANSEIVIGGSSKNVPVDNIAPNVKLYMEDTNFVSGGYTNSNTLFLARLFDENGINISGNGFGQNLTAVLDEETTYNLNDFYETDLDSYQSGWVAFPINDLAPGEHTIRFKAWDTFNNSSEAEIAFKVNDNNKIIFENLYNYPNPFNQKTTFYIEHNRAGDDITLSVEIYSLKGELVGKIDYYYENSPRTINSITWDRLGKNGKPVGNGVYIYKVYMTSDTDGAKNQQYQKLVIIN